jgi:predicted DNA-binding protein
MRSVRLDYELEARLEEAARVSGEPVSELIREAVRRRCDEVLGGRLDRRLADVVGAVSGGGSSRKTGEAFAAVLAARARAKSRKGKRGGRR